MLTEINCAVDFLCSLIGSREREQDLTQLRIALAKLFEEKFQNHWHPENSSRGSAYRSICNTPKGIDPLLANASQAAKFPIDGLLPRELTLWVDPQEVSYRIGTEGSVCHLNMASVNGSPLSSSSYDQRTGSPSSASPSSSRSASPPVVNLTTATLTEQRSPPLFPTRPRTTGPAPAPSHPYQSANYQPSHHHAPHRSSSVAGYPYSYSQQLPQPGQYSAGHARFMPSFMQQDMNMYRYA